MAWPWLSLSITMVVKDMNWLVICWLLLANSWLDFISCWFWAMTIAVTLAFSASALISSPTPWTPWQELEGLATLKSFANQLDTRLCATIDYKSSFL